MRVAPNDVSIANPEAIQIIYGKGKLLKTGFCDAFRPYISKNADTFSDRDEVHHAWRRRILAHIYTQGSILQYEWRLARLVERFKEAMKGLAPAEQTFDVSTCFRRYVLLFLLASKAADTA